MPLPFIRRLPRRQADRLAAYWQLMRADKPIGTQLLLWPTLWALWIASDGLPDFTILLAFAVGTFRCAAPVVWPTTLPTDGLTVP